MVLQSRKFGCVWKPGFVKSGHIYIVGGSLSGFFIYLLMLYSTSAEGL